MEKIEFMTKASEILSTDHDLSGYQDITISKLLGELGGWDLNLNSGGVLSWIQRDYSKDEDECAKTSWLIESLINSSNEEFENGVLLSDHSFKIGYWKHLKGDFKTTILDNGDYVRYTRK